MPAKGVITFLSEDKEHSHQQIQEYEHRMFEIVGKKLDRPLNHWIRYSNGCGAQFKSGYVVADIKVYHSITLNPMRVKAVLIVLGQLLNAQVMVC